MEICYGSKDFITPSFRITVYVPQLRTWYDSRSHTEVLSCSVMNKVESSISTSGLTGVDRLLAFLIVTELQVILLVFLFIESCQAIIFSDNFFREIIVNYRQCLIFYFMYIY